MADFQSNAGLLLGSPANADPVPPQDVQPDELDVAIGVDRLQQATTLPIARLRNRWAGLRSFVADKTPVCGMEAHVDSFFWLAGQGGYGIQTAPALGQLTTALLLNQPLPPELVRCGVEAAQFAPGRFNPKGCSGSERC